MDALYELFIAPWGSGAWMWRGMLASTLSAIMLAVLGVFLYLRRMSLLADALAHVALPGIVVAFLLSGSLDPTFMLLGAAATGLFASFAIEGLSGLPNIRSDAAIGIVFTALFALGVILVSTSVHDAHIDTQCVLFGNVLAISDRALWLLGVTAPAVLLVVAIFYRWLAVSSFDETLALSLGIPVGLVHYGLMTTTSIATVASFETVGAVLAIAMIVVPAATAHLLADRLPSMIGIAVLHGLISSVFGMYLSIWINASTGGAIVVVGGALYGVAFLFAPRHGWVWRRWRGGSGSVSGGEASESVVDESATRKAPSTLS
jgi:manganese/zinc/iron transport system permease protein